MDREFFRVDALTLAEKLIGKTLVHRVRGVEICGVISETEAYMGVTDKACHAYGGRRTKRTETMYMDGGHAYVYLIYGMYSCMNVTANISNVPEAVLIRAVYPVGGAEALLENVRSTSRRKHLPSNASDITAQELYSFADGPGKLCNAMGITRSLNGCDMLSGDFFIRDDGWEAAKILRAPRIGIDYAEEAVEFPWRFTAETKDKIPIFVNKNGEYI